MKTPREIGIVQGNTSPVIRVRPEIDGEGIPATLDNWTCRMVLVDPLDKSTLTIDRMVTDKTEENDRFICYLEPTDTADLEVGKKYTWAFELVNLTTRPRYTLEKTLTIFIKDQWIP